MAPVVSIPSHCEKWWMGILTAEVVQVEGWLLADGRSMFVAGSGDLWMQSMRVVYTCIIMYIQIQAHNHTHTHRIHAYTYNIYIYV